MNQQRRIKRNIVRNKCYNRDGNIKSFAAEWGTRKMNNKKTKTN